MKLKSTLTVAVLLVLLGRPSHANITIGPGPVIGTDKFGVTFYQEFQDWSNADVRVLGTNGTEYSIASDTNYDNSRDLIAFYSRQETTNYYFRTDFFDLLTGANTSHVFVYVAINCAAGGSTNLPDGIKTVTTMPYQLCVCLYGPTVLAIKDLNGNTLNSSNSIGSYWSTSIGSVKFGIQQSVLQSYGWTPGAPLSFQVYTTCGTSPTGGVYHISGQSDIVKTIGSTLIRNTGSGIGLLSGSISSTATVNQAKFAAIAHGNQSLTTRTNIENLIYIDSSIDPTASYNICGYSTMLDTHQMFNVPLNLHMSGTLIEDFLWTRQNPTDTGSGAYPVRDGPTLINRINGLVQSNVCSIIGGVYSENFLPWFEGSVNQGSIAAFNNLAQSVFGLTASNMTVMWSPERVMESNTNWAHANPAGPLTGRPFADILAGGYQATILDEVSHLHWWFYPQEAVPGFVYPGYSDAVWTTNFPPRWAGWTGNSQARYHHKIHKINGVLTFMINDREDGYKFWNWNGGLYLDSRSNLLEIAMSSDPDQITVVMDDWEAYSGISFGSGYNDNPAQWENVVRWLANHQWIDVVSLQSVISMAQTDSNWVVDHGYVYTNALQSYEYLMKATEHDPDNWYYGYSNTTTKVYQENYFGRVPATEPGGLNIAGTESYGDLNTPGTLTRDSWNKVAAAPPGNLQTLAQWQYYAMIYETAWHDENPPAGWNSASNWSSAYHSCNYQTNFNNVLTGSYENSNATDGCSVWLDTLAGHMRSVGILADAAQWVQDINNNVQGSNTVAVAKDVDDDLIDEYILKNNHVYLCFKRWGGRLVEAFVYNPAIQDAVEVIGQPVANPAEESDEEDEDNIRCSGFKDRYVSGLANNNSQYVDMDYGQSVVQGSNYWVFTSLDGKIKKQITLPNGRDVVEAQYTVSPTLGTLSLRHGFGPNQMDLLLHGDTNLIVQSDSTYYGLSNAMGGAVYAVCDVNCLRNTGSLQNAGYQNRGFPMTEQVELYNANGATNFTTWLAFSPASAVSVQGDGIPNWWRLQYFGSITGSATNNSLAQNDADGTGQNNLFKYVAGLNPTNPASVFVLNVTSATNQVSAMNLSFNSLASGRTYTPQFCTDLVSGVWMPLTTYTSILTNGNQVTITDTNPIPPQEFYRINIALP
ncbi:MAG: hypothetical protein ABSD58_01125 [Verrucomicrobiia bacterium]|jgi:hypothetical protein